MADRNTPRSFPPVEMSKTVTLAAYRDILAHDPCSYCGHFEPTVRWEEQEVRAWFPYVGPAGTIEWGGGKENPDCMAATYRSLSKDSGHWSGNSGHYRFDFTGSHRDHIVPTARGGENSRDNLPPVCPSCDAKEEGSPPLHRLLEREA